MGFHLSRDDGVCFFYRNKERFISGLIFSPRLLLGTFSHLSRECHDPLLSIFLTISCTTCLSLSLSCSKIQLTYSHLLLQTRRPRGKCSKQRAEALDTSPFSSALLSENFLCSFCRFNFSYNLQQHHILFPQRSLDCQSTCGGYLGMWMMFLQHTSQKNQ